MEASQSLILNEDALAKIPEAKKSLFIYEWLRFLENVLMAAQKVCRIIRDFPIQTFLSQTFIFSTRMTLKSVKRRWLSS